MIRRFKVLRCAGGLSSASHHRQTLGRRFIMDRLPTVKLDTTLAELYRQASPKNAQKRIGQVLCGTNSALDLSDDFPRNVKYIYQDSPFNSLPKEELHEDNHELRRSLAMKYLSLVPQRDAFICGKTAVILFNVDQTPEQIAHDKEEAKRTVAVLEESQRPDLVFCPGPSRIPMEEKRIDLLGYKLALDSLSRYPTTCDLDTHWFLNSKEALASSGLPTPACEIITLDDLSPDVLGCCDSCRGDRFFIAPECSGERAKWLQIATDRVMDSVKTPSLPFVLKNQQAFAGAGTFMVKDEKKRKELLQTLEDGLLRKLFSQITSENHHLKPGTILLSDMVDDPSEDYGLTFFATEEGKPIFLAVSEQMIDPNSAWIGSTINYEHQDKLKKKFTPIMEKIASWLHSHGYYGPVGADILETAPQNESLGGSMDNMNIVDLNVRTSGSLCLPLMRSHFTSHGYRCASSFSITVKSTREEFIKPWEEMIERGQICILSWYEDKKDGVSIGDVAVGGETEEKLEAAMKGIRDTSEQVTF